MAQAADPTWRTRFERHGCVFPLNVLTEEEAAAHRARLEQAEAEHGPMHYRQKPHLLLTTADEIGRHPRLLDAIEAILGPDILLWDSGYIVKEPGEGRFVSWHQDLTYWGLDSDAMVNAWVALSPATPESGCMQVVPGSHLEGPKPHRDTSVEDNLLHRGQDASEHVDTSKAVHMALRPGQASLHHGWVFHGSGANQSQDRRIGLTLQYTATHVRQLHYDSETATLVRGRDRYGHFRPEPPCKRDFDPANVEFQAEAQRLKHELYDSF